jgi:hypothetical protein
MNFFRDIAEDNLDAVVLDFVDPVRPIRNLRGLGGDAGFER